MLMYMYGYPIQMYNRVEIEILLYLSNTEG